MDIGQYSLAIIAKTQQGLFAVPPNDQIISKALLEDGEYNSAELQHLQTLIQPNSRVLFVGSHIGALLIPIAKLCQQVIAYEANPHTYELLNINLNLNNITNCQTHNLAASDNDKSLDFLLNTLNSGGSKRIPIIKDEMYYYDQPEICTVPGVVLDDHIKEKKFDLIVMDIEGSEYFALKGMQEILDNCKTLQIEFIPHHLKNVSGVSVEEFLTLITPHFSQLYIPMLNFSVARKGFRVALKEMYDNNLSDEGIIFTK